MLGGADVCSPFGTGREVQLIAGCGTWLLSFAADLCSHGDPNAYAWQLYAICQHMPGSYMPAYAWQLSATLMIDYLFARKHTQLVAPQANAPNSGYMLRAC